MRRFPPVTYKLLRVHGNAEIPLARLAFSLPQTISYPRKAVSRTLRRSPSISVSINVRENKSMVDTFLQVQVPMDRQFSMVRAADHPLQGSDNIPPFDSDVRFDPTARHWSWSWSVREKSPEVVLDRPHPAEGVTPSAFVGDWEGYPDPTARFRGAPGTLHIRQGCDGGLTAWLDRTIQTDQRNGERLSVLSVTQSAIAPGTVSDWGAKHRYEGTLSGDGKQMGGQWHSDGGGILNAPTLYRLLDQSTRHQLSFCVSVPVGHVGTVYGEFKILKCPLRHDVDTY